MVEGARRPRREAHGVVPAGRATAGGRPRARRDPRPRHRVRHPRVGRRRRRAGGRATRRSSRSRRSMCRAPSTATTSRPGDQSVWAEPELPVAPPAYAVTQRRFASKDGTEVPMFVRPTRPTWSSTGPTRPWLTGYGGFNNSMTPAFSALATTWLESGGVFALANMRGGGEFGEAWHRAGMLESKQNVFDDFIAAAEHLVAEGYTSPEHLAIRGRQQRRPPRRGGVEPAARPLRGGGLHLPAARHGPLPPVPRGQLLGARVRVERRPRAVRLHPRVTRRTTTSSTAATTRRRCTCRATATHEWRRCTPGR